jgi:hypothetical protein
LSTLKVLSLAGVDFNSTLPAQGNSTKEHLSEY